MYRPSANTISLKCTTIIIDADGVCVSRLRGRIIVYYHGPGSDDDARDRGPGQYVVYSCVRGRRECVIRSRRIRCAWSVARDRRARSLMRTERVRPTDRTFYTTAASKYDYTIIIIVVVVVAAKVVVLHYRRPQRRKVK